MGSVLCRYSATWIRPVRAKSHLRTRTILSSLWITPITGHRSTRWYTVLL